MASPFITFRLCPFVFIAIFGYLSFSENKNKVSIGYTQPCTGLENESLENTLNLSIEY